MMLICDCFFNFMLDILSTRKCYDYTTIKLEARQPKLAFQYKNNKIKVFKAMENMHFNKNE